MENERYPSETGKIKQYNESVFDATCTSCGSTQNIRLFPHRNDYGNMIGFLFFCDKCCDNIENIKITIDGIR